MNPISPSPERGGSVVLDYDETVVSTDPFEGRFRFSLDGESITLTVDDDLEVTDTRRQDSG